MASVWLMESASVLVLFVLTVLGEQGDYFIHHHCYYEGGLCSLKKITCDKNTVIDIIWSRVGYSQYWESDGTHTNCSVTDETCYEEIDEPKMNCSGLTECVLDTCSTSTRQGINTCAKPTNYVMINYTCLEAGTTGIPSTSGRATTTGTHLANQINVTKVTPTLPSSTTGQTTVIVIAVVVTVALITAFVVVVVVVIRKRQLLNNEESTRTSESEIDQSEVVIIENENYVSKDAVRPVQPAPTERTSQFDTDMIDNDFYASADQSKANKNN